MRAAILYQTGKPLEIEELILPQLKPGQILVKVNYSGVCHSQLMEVRGLRGEDRYLPHLLGHEGSGTVVDIGPDVSKVKKDDEVILGWIKGHGIEAGGTVYKTKNGNKTINSGGVTTFSDYTIVSENRVVKKPSELSNDIAVLFGCAIPTGAGLMMNQIAPQQPGQSLLIIGLGGIGMSGLIAARLFEFNTVIAVDIDVKKLELAKEFGATHTLIAGQPNLLDSIMDITNGKGVDHAMEAAGRVDTIELGFHAVKKGGGRLVFASHPKHGDKISLDPFDLICGKKIEGSWGGASHPDEDIPKVAKLCCQGTLPFHRLLSEPLPLDQINHALDALEQQKVMRALIQM